MSDSVVSAQTVVNVLRGHKVDVSTREGRGGIEETVMIYNETVEVKCFQATVSRRLLSQLTRKFPHVPIHHFYHPEQAPQKIIH